MAIIYKITNKINGKIYIGETTSSLEQRWKDHCRDGKNSDHNKSVLHDAIHKYGADNFSIEQIDEVPDEQRFEKETEYIIKYQSLVSQYGYNIVLYGSGYGIYNANDFIELWEQGYTQQEIIDIIGCSQGTVKKFLSSYGVTSFDFSSRGSIKSARKRRLNKPIEQYNLDGQFIQEWESASDCARNNIDFTQSGISQACRGKINSYKGYLWKMKEDTTPIEVLVQRYLNTPEGYKPPKRIAQIDKNTKQITCIYDSAAQAARELGIKHKTNICLAARKGTLSHGYYWEYLEE